MVLFNRHQEKNEENAETGKHIPLLSVYMCGRVDYKCRIYLEEQEGEVAKALTGLQLRIMNVLWENGDSSIREILEALEYEKNLARTTVATIISRLESQGLISHRKSGLSYIYHPLVSRDEVRQSMVGELLETLFEGDRSELVCHLINEADCDPGEIEKVIEMLATHQRRDQSDD